MSSSMKVARKQSKLKINASESAFLDAAEFVFARNGYSGTSMRAVSEKAQANLGAIHYYFGSKEKLFEKVFERKMPSAEERVERIKACIRKSEDSVPDFKLLIKAFFEPLWEIHEIDPAFDEMVIRVIHDPALEVGKLVAKYFDEPQALLIELLRKCNPKLSENEFFWRLNCVISSLINLLTGRARLEKMARGGLGFTSIEEDQGLDLTIESLNALLMAPPKITQS